MRGFLRSPSAANPSRVGVFLLVWLVIAVAATAAHRMTEHQLGKSIFAGTLASVFLMNFISNWLVNSPASYIAPLWSLSVEEQFYLLLPITLIGLLRFTSRRTAMIAFLALLAVAEWRTYTVALDSFNGLSVIYFRLDTHGAPLVAGCLLAFATSTRWARWLGYPALALFLACCFLCRVSYQPSYLAFYPVATIAGVGIIAAALADGHFSRALSWRPLVYLGLISYSLYLWHYPIVRLLPHDPVLAVALSVGAAILSYHLVEQPFRRRGRARRVPVTEPVALTAQRTQAREERCRSRTAVPLRSSSIVRDLNIPREDHLQSA